MKNIYLENVASIFANSLRKSLRKFNDEEELKKISPNIDEVKKEIESKFDIIEELDKIEHFEQLFLVRIDNQLYANERLLITLTSDIVLDVIESCKLTNLLKFFNFFHLIDFFAVYIDDEMVLTTESSISSDINVLLPNIEYSIV